MTYQHIQKYKGSLYGNLNYSGIEYDYEVPDNVVIASPGGVSAIQHHYTKGMYSDAVSTTDIHPGNPRADAYPYGEYGNVYQMGQGATRLAGDFLPGDDLRPGNSFTENQSEVRRENFGPVDGSNSVQLIPPPDSPTTTTIPPAPDAPSKKIQNLENTMKIAALIATGYIGINFLQKAGEDFISNKFFGDRALKWKDYLIMAGIFIGLLVGLAYLFNIPLVSLEHRI
jgi:hypothetical protein